MKRRIPFLLLFLALVGGERLWAQIPTAKKRVWASVELSVAPTVVSINDDADRTDCRGYTSQIAHIGARAFGGIYLSRRLSVGVGTGLSYYDGLYVLSIPVLGELKYITPAKGQENASWYIYGRGGYPFLLGRNNGDGLLAGVGLGATFGKPKGLNYHISIGYSLTHLDYYRTHQNTHRVPTRHAIELKWGLLW